MLQSSPAENRTRESIWIVTGEASGDLHGGELIHELRKLLPSFSFRGIGGPHLLKEEVDLLFHIRELAVMGLTEVLVSVPRIYTIFRKVVKTMKAERPRAIILVDFPDFNLRLAKKAHKLGIPVIYYISPQLWAWRKSRIKIIKKNVTKMIVIFPFEQQFYADHGVDAFFSGYPLCEKLTGLHLNGTQIKKEFVDFEGQPLLGILPGSRHGEVQRTLPPIIESLKLIHKRFPAVKVILPIAPTIDEKMLRSLIKKSPVPISIVSGKTYELLAAADCIVVASGTATLEAACSLTPMIVVYKLTALSYTIAKKLVHVSHIAMANLVARREIVPELIQKELTPEKIAAHVTNILENKKLREQMRHDLESVRQELICENSYQKAASAIVKVIQGGKG